MFCSCYVPIITLANLQWKSQNLFALIITVLLHKTPYISSNETMKSHDVFVIDRKRFDLHYIICIYIYYLNILVGSIFISFWVKCFWITLNGSKPLIPQNTYMIWCSVHSISLTNVSPVDKISPPKYIFQNMSSKLYTIFDSFSILCTHLWYFVLIYQSYTIFNIFIVKWAMCNICGTLHEHQLLPTPTAFHFLKVML